MILIQFATDGAFPTEQSLSIRPIGVTQGRNWQENCESCAKYL